MIIDSLHIYGFGKFEDKQIKLKKGINLIEGLNEAGKSTIMAFIRAILFGFEGRRNNHLRYEPLKGGRFGGAIELIDNKAEKYRIERVYYQKASGDVKIYLPNGEVAMVDQLPKLIGRINEKVYQQIYSFSLTELQQIDSLQDDQINDFIYHSGTGAVTQILKMKQFIEQKQLELFRNSGKKPKINELLAESELVASKINAIKEKHDQHQSLVNRIKQFEKELKEIDKLIESNNSELNWLSKVKHYFENHKKIKQIDNTLATFPKTIQFPDNGLARLEQLIESINELTVEYQQLADQEEKLNKEIQETEYDEFFIENEALIINLKEQLSFFQEQQKQNNSLITEKENAENRIAENLSQLGSSFTIEIVREINFTIADKQAVQELINKLVAILNQLDELNKELELKGKRNQEIQKNLNKLEQQQASLERSNIGKISHEARRYWQSIKEKEMQKNYIIQQQQGLDKQLKELSTSQRTPFFIYFFNGLSFLISGILLFFQLFGYAGIAFAFSLLLLLVTILGRSRGNNSLINSTKLSLRQINKQLLLLEEEITAKKEAILALIRPLGFNKVDEFAIESLEQIRDEELIKLQNERLQENKRDLLIDELETINNDIKQLSERFKNAATIHLQLKNSYEEWLVKHALNRNLSTMIVFETISIIQATKDLIRKNETHLEQLENNNKYISEYAGKITEIAEKLELPEKKPEEVVFHLSEQLKKNLEAKILIKNNYQLLDNLIVEKNKNKGRLNQKSNQYQELLDYANTKDNESFIRLAKTYSDYQTLLNDKRQLIIMMKNGCNSDEEYNRLVTEYDVWNLNDLTAKLTEISEMIKEDTLQIKQFSEEKGSLQNQLQKMEEDYTLSELNQEYERFKAELKDKVKNYSAFGLAQYILNQTMKEYEITKQPLVIKRATSYFSQLTDNSYSQIVAPFGQSNIEVIRADGVRLLPQYLSRGTIEQLFLAMRLSLVEEFSKEISLPVILDDIFVNFDAKRLRNTLVTLKQIAENNQIILFTCHLHISEMLKKTVDNVEYLTIT